ncbi:phage major capsid protein [Candidatus Deianiraea vastatrix]|uniref:Phage capsid family protein n=1 Tax=Candidatus Deianiraea vastatrix TaxID=2163644 RepID=A0A5B8XIN1_9RICK|nr:phage major capsid protein [Candidatus Deianiraea vastatrix]QED23814.1 Phage capsid family protein [Candidatus Deianiraea vastatrix]
MQTQLKDQIAQAYNDLKAVNDQACNDPLVAEQIQKLNDKIDALTVQFNAEMAKQQATVAVNSLMQAGNAQQKSLKIAQPALNLPVDQKSAFVDYARTGDFVSNYDSGYPFSQRMNDIILSFLSEKSVIRKFANQVQVSRDTFEFVRNKESVAAQWSDGTTAPDSIEGYEKLTIKINDLIAQPKVTQKLLSDVNIDFENWLATELAQIFLVQENDAFINGNGINKPQGILSYANSGSGIETVKSGDAAKITVDGLVNLIYSLGDVYSEGAVMLMNKTTVQEIRKLKDANGQYLWMPGILSGKADTIMGVPLYTISNIPSIAAGSLCAIYGNLNQGYLIADHQNVAIQRDPFSAKPFVSFYSTKRVGGDVVNQNAFKVLKISA